MKRRRAAETPAIFREGLARTPQVSSYKAAQLWNAWNPSADQRVTARAARRAREAERSAHGHCFQRLSCPAQGGELTLVVARLPALMQTVADAAPSWGDAFLRGLPLGAQTAQVQGIIYSDEVIGGNILSVQKKKKVSLFYVGFRRMADYNLRGATWLCVAAVQACTAQAAAGSMSAITATIVRGLTDSVRSGFTWNHAGRELRVSLQAPLLCLADGDAARAMFGFKGAAGIRCCWRCSNVVSQCLEASRMPEQFVRTSEARADRFVLAEDHELFAAVDELASLRGQARQMFEKTSGLTAAPVMTQCRLWLPPSALLFDTMHLYYSNGLVSWEMQMCRAALEASFPSFTLGAIQKALGESEWWKPGVTRPRNKAILEWFREKFWDEIQFKGMARETLSAFSMFYYAVQCVFGGSAVGGAVIASLDALWLVCRELTRLRYSPTPVLCAGQVEELNRLQQVHQARYNAAYGESCAKPKHHWRMHVPAGALQLGDLPCAETQEQKHKAYKRDSYFGYYDRRVNDGAGFQSAVLDMELSSQIAELEEQPLCTWSTLGAVTPAALRQLPADAVQATGLRAFRSTVFVGDIVLWTDGRGGRVTHCYASAAGRWLRMAALQRCAQTVWGSQWRLTSETCMWQVDRTDWFFMPHFWKQSQDTFDCVH